MKVVVIGLHGLAGSGKDTAFNFIRAAAPGATKVLEARMAGPMYAMLQTLMPMIDATKLNPVEKAEPRKELAMLSIREFLIGIGEGMRAQKEDFWTSLFWTDVFDQLGDVPEGYDAVVVCPDVRRSNEVKAIRDIVAFLNTLQDTTAVGKIVQIVAKGGPDNPHYHAATETELDTKMIDVKLTNDRDEWKWRYHINLKTVLSLSLGDDAQMVFDEAICAATLKGHALVTYHSAPNAERFSCMDCQERFSSVENLLTRPHGRSRIGE